MENKEFKEMQGLITFEWGCIKKYLIEKNTPLSDNEWDEVFKTLLQKGNEMKQSIYYEPIKKMLVLASDFIANKYKRVLAGIVPTSLEEEKNELYEAFQFSWRIIKEYAVMQEKPLDSEGWDNLMKMSSEYVRKENSMYADEIGKLIVLSLDFVEVKYSYLNKNAHEKNEIKRAV